MQSTKENLLDTTHHADARSNELNHASQLVTNTNTNRHDQPNTSTSTRTRTRTGTEMDRSTCPLLDFSDGIKFLIFSFSHGNFIHETSPVAQLFKTFGFLSKDCYRSCIRYIQQTPIKYGNIYNANTTMESFLCRNRIKLESIDLSLADSLSTALSIHALRNCDLSEMKSIYIGAIMTKEFDNNLIEKAVSTGIPRQAIDEFVHPAQYDRIAIQETITDILQENSNAPSLKAMEIVIRKEEWFRPILTKFSNQLEKLHLYIDWDEIGGKFPYDEKAKEISSVIENMPNLKHLVLQVNSYMGGSFRVKSASLEEIDTRLSKNFYLEECICPSLRMLYCTQRFDLCLIKNGVHPVIPFTNEELKSVNDDGNDQYVDVKVGDRDFVGMDAPASCIVRMYGKSEVASGMNQSNLGELNHILASFRS